MRFVISIIAALMILSLAACYRVSAENAHDARTEDEFGSHDKAAWHRTGTGDLPHDR